MYRKLENYKQVAFMFVCIGTFSTFIYSIFILRLAFKGKFSLRISVYSDTAK